MAGKFTAKHSAVRHSLWLNITCLLVLPLCDMILMEWAHRGSFSAEFWAQQFAPHAWSFLFGWLFLVFVYGVLCMAFGRHWPAQLILGVVCFGFGAVTYLKLQMRGEPLLPWDFSQLSEFFGVASKVNLSIPWHFFAAGACLAVLCVCSIWVRLPQVARRGRVRVLGAVLNLALLALLCFGVLLRQNVCEFFGIWPDMWMQDRYYRNHGIVTGFVTNLRVLNITAPDGYGEAAVQQLAQETQQAAETRQPLFPNSYAAAVQESEQETRPNIIYLMNESFWDVTRLEGIEYDRELTPNLNRLKQQAAYGYCFSPSYGGGTCDVEFEALTGFSLEHLPSGAKPYQQYATKPLPALPQHLKAQGYETLAVHGYGRKFWSRDTAYPNLGIDTFIAQEDFVSPDTRRGFISDHAMAQRIIEEYEARAEAGPLFIHAVTMQNHTTYDESRYPESELVNIVKHPGLSEETLSQLRDFATGVHEADAALGELIAYFEQREEPVIVVFWGDHFNPVGKGSELYEKTGFIEPGDSSTMHLRQTDLLIWSNYYDASVDLGTIAAYEISPVMMDLYGLDMPLWFEKLAEELPVLRARTRGVTVEPDSSLSESMTPQQEALFGENWLIQYDLMFGKNYWPAQEGAPQGSSE